MGDVVNIKPPPMSPDVATLLRKMADAVEAGCITEMVVAYVDEGDYAFMWPSSRIDSLVLATLAQNRAIERMKE